MRTTGSYVTTSLAPDIRMDNSYALTGLDKGLSTDTNAALFTINSYINLLRNAYTALHNEDETYHEELLLAQKEAAKKGED